MSVQSCLTCSLEAVSDHRYILNTKLYFYFVSPQHFGAYVQNKLKLNWVGADFSIKCLTGSYNNWDLKTENKHEYCNFSDQLIRHKLIPCSALNIYLFNGKACSLWAFYLCCLLIKIMSHPFIHPLHLLYNAWSCAACACLQHSLDESFSFVSKKDK